MENHWNEDDWNHLEGSEGKKEPFVKEIVLPPTLYKHALRRGYETYKEVGFYLIGLFKKGVCYIHDLIEFEYSEQSGGFIESGMARYMRLKAGLPLGLRIIGHMHKHPGFTQYSDTDKRNFLKYGYANPLNAFLIYIVEPKEKISGYTATAEKIFPVNVSIRELTPDEQLLEKEIKVKFTTKVLIPKNSTYSDFRMLFSEKVSSESLKFLSRPSIQVKGNVAEKNSIISKNSKIEVVPRKVIEIEDVTNNPDLRYRLFMDERETIADLEKSLKQLTNRPKEKGYEVVFYEKGRKLTRATKLKVIKHPLVWSLEKSVLLPIFQNFHKFWEEIIEILQQKESEKIQKALEDSETEVISQHSSNLSKESGLQIIFKNFSTFLNDIFQVLENKNAEKSQKTAKVGDSLKKPEDNLKKKKKNLKRYKLDYYT